MPMITPKLSIAAVLVLLAAPGCVPRAELAEVPQGHQAAGSTEARERLPAGAVLYFVDGREVSAAVAAAVQPSEIQAVQVLKGREAVDRYGQRAASGAVVVTTKAARPGR